MVSFIQRVRCCALLLLAVSSGVGAGCASTVSPIAPDPIEVDTPRAAPLVRVTATSEVPGLEVRIDESVAREVLAETGTVAIHLDNRGDVVREASLEVVLPEGAIVSRLALEVDGRWMEAEVLPRAAAARIYQQIVHPEAGPRKDPALMVERTPGRWSLQVFPVPAGGGRDLELVWHRLRAPGRAEAAKRSERRAIPTGGSETVFALAPAREAGMGREGREAAPLARVVIAVDTSLSMGDEGLARARTLVAGLIRALPVETIVVAGDLEATPCKGDVAACLAGPVGGASDLGALLAAASEAARRGLVGRAAVVLMSDGLPTIGADARALRSLVGELVAAAPIALFTVPIARSESAMSTAGRALLASLAEVGLGADVDVEGPDTSALASALSRPRAPRVTSRVLAGEVGALGVTWVADRPIVLGTSRSANAEVEVTWSDDRGSTRSRFTVGRDAGPARYGLFQALGRALIAQHEAAFDLGPVDLAALARDHGVAGAFGSLIALETDGDYQRRGIARAKAFEVAASRGLPVDLIPSRALADEEALRVDGDGDGIPDAQDRCPAEPEVFNGVEDDDGCPDRAIVRILQSEIRIIDRVYFDRGQSLIQRQATPLLDEVAQVMKQHPWIGVVEVSGHCDNQEARARGLSLARAEAVRKALILRGVEKDRLVVVGYGAERPIIQNDTPDGRARNRRAEFTILVARGELVGGGATASSIAALVERMGLTPKDAHRKSVGLLLSAGLRDDASTHLEAAIGLAATPAAKLAVFDETSAAAFPARYAEVGLLAIEATGSASLVLPRVFWSAVLPLLTEANRAKVEPAIRAHLATRTAAARRQSTRVDLETEARLLTFIGDPREARRRTSEVVELGL